MTFGGISRRGMLQVLAGGAVYAVAPAQATETRIARLIEDAKAWATVGQRIDFISRALLGTTYKGYTLVGGPEQAEKFVVRDDAFDCVTFCETVLAAALARDIGGFEQELRNIRYHNGVVSWRERNHYFFEWSRHNVENGLCRPITVDGSVTVNKTVFWHRDLGRRKFQMTAIPRAKFLAGRQQLASGDIVGFVTMRADLDYFHVGFVTFGNKGELMLRHASRSHHRVLDERMDAFTAFNRVRFVTLLRPLEPAAQPLVSSVKTDDTLVTNAIGNAGSAPAQGRP